jgi:acetoin utilization protein AcuC
MTQSDRISLVYHPDLFQYDFGAQHPLRPERIELGLDLLNDLGIWSVGTETCVPVAAPDNLLSLIHSSQYIAAVREVDSGILRGSELARFGLSSSDNPPFPNMHYASSLVAGGAAEATRAVMRRELDHVFHPTGGLHHAGRSRASGFCIYNDPALAAAVAAKEFGARVAYVDFDCHHGDGVQWLFYDDPSVLTVSFHESGRFLFPGTGGVEERGEGEGAGYATNFPFVPFTQDASWTHVIHTVLPPLLNQFAPDLLLTVHGCDTHAWDPLTHLSLTTDAFVNQARLVHELAHRHCDGRWVAFGSGGYDWRRVVPRSWAIVWSEMSERPLPRELPPAWLSRWHSDDLEPLPPHFRDNPDNVHPVRVDEIESANRETLSEVMKAIGLG